MSKFIKKKIPPSAYPNQARTLCPAPTSHPPGKKGLNKNNNKKLKPYDGNNYVALFVYKWPFADTMQSSIVPADAVGRGGDLECVPTCVLCVQRAKSTYLFFVLVNKSTLSTMTWRRKEDCKSARALTEDGGEMWRSMELWGCLWSCGVG